MEPVSPFNTASPQAEAISHLFLGVFAISLVIFALVAGLVFYMAVRFRERPGGPPPSTTVHNRTLEIAWTAIPALILVGLMFFTVRVMHNSLPLLGQKPDVRVTARQWWWEVQYPPSGVVTANEIHLPLGKNLMFRLDSTDVIHTFWVPELGPKMQAIPGRANYFALTPTRAGTFWGTCAQYCGLDHAWMHILVIVEPQADFDKWVQAQLQAPPPPTGPEAVLGAQVFRQRTCINCHSVAGTLARGLVGPDLTHVASRRTLAAGAVQNTPENLTRWIKNPQAVKPGNHMPTLRLTDAEMTALVAYLEELR